MGIPIMDSSPPALVAHLVDRVQHGQRAIIAHVNAHAMNLLYEQPQLYHFYAQAADIVFCDGFGVKIGGRLLGLSIRHRLTPPDWIDLLCERCAEERLSLFLLGSREGVAQKAAEDLQRRHPDLSIVGVHHGYFNKSQNHPENRQAIAKINAAQPDFLLVAFGMPLQELWLLENWPILDTRVAMTVGALLDYLAGELRRPPRWMTDHGLEWFGRLFVEPGRLWQRYIVGNPRFLWRVLKYRLSIKPAHME
jgi:N-acetylglucosaminyldiphosphoundecaprenol N-acetyl-beta-D-mannosaminyltransferase